MAASSGQLDEYVDDGFCPDAIDCRAADVVDCMRQARGQDSIERGGLLSIPASPTIPMLHKRDGKELPELLKGHVGQGFGHR